MVIINLSFIMVKAGILKRNEAIANCGVIKIGFISEVYFEKDSIRNFINKQLTNELILQQRGDFSTKPSNPNETF